MTTVCVAGLAAGAATPGPLRPSAAARRTTEPALLERALDLLGMLEVRDERRPHLDQERLQLRVRDAGDQRLVDGVEHRLVIRDLVVDVRLVERRALQRLEVGDVLLAALLQALA